MPRDLVTALLLTILCLPIPLLSAEPAAVVTERAGGLVPCEDLPGAARVMRGPQALFVPHADGSPVALCFVASGSGDTRRMTVIHCDIATGVVRQEQMPDKLGNPWGKVWGPDGRLYLGLWSPATMIRYDPVADRIEYFGIMEPDPPYKGTCAMTVGSDDRVYAISGGWCFSIDPATDAVARYGHQGPKRQYPIAYSGTVAVDDDYIYSTFGNVASETFTVAMNKTTREQTLLKSIWGARFQQRRDGVTAKLGADEYWMVAGKPVLKQARDEKPPWPDRARPERKSAPKLTGKPEFHAGMRDAQGKTAVRFRADAKSEWKNLTLDLPSEDVPLTRIIALPDGRIAASTRGYEGINAFDPRTKSFSYVGMIPLSHYSSLIVDGKVYLSGYPQGASCWLWDPARPWTIDKDSIEDDNKAGTRAGDNPRRMNRWEKPGNFQFPLFMVQAADKCVYAAIHGERSDVGGILSWRDPATDKGAFLREPFRAYDPCGLCTTLGGTKVVMSTVAVNGLNGEPRPTTGRLFIIDAATHAVDAFIDPLPGVDSAGFVVESRPGKLLLATDHRTGWDFHRYDEGKHVCSYLYEVDVAKSAVTRKVELPGVLGGRRDYFWDVDFRLGPDGMVYTWYDDLLVSIDPDTLKITALSKVDPAGNIAFSGRDIYIAGTPHFRRVAGVLGPEKAQ